MTAVDDDIDAAKGLASEMFSDEKFVEFLSTAEDEQERAARVIFYVLQKQRES